MERTRVMVRDKDREPKGPAELPLPGGGVVERLDQPPVDHLNRAEDAINAALCHLSYEVQEPCGLFAAESILRDSYEEITDSMNLARSCLTDLKSELRGGARRPGDIDMKRALMEIKKLKLDAKAICMDVAWLWAHAQKAVETLEPLIRAQDEAVIKAARDDAGLPEPVRGFEPADMKWEDPTA
jgi:hypothetical protein